MKQVLVKYDDNWADEMDVTGHKVISEDAWNKFLELVDKIEFPITIGVGSNEEIDYDTKEQLLGAFSVVEVTTEFAHSWKYYFNDYSFGEFPLSQIVESVELTEDECEYLQWFFNEIY